MFHKWVMDMSVFEVIPSAVVPLTQFMNLIQHRLAMAFAEDSNWEIPCLEYGIDSYFEQMNQTILVKIALKDPS